jgi:predicted nucleic acid binding AN1-type Zn finger protein
MVVASVPLSATSATAAIAIAATASVPAAAAASSPVESAGAPAQLNKERCYHCRKKVGLLGFTCKCDFVFCSTHRYPKEHQCTYDHAAVTREKLTKQNPLIQAAKVDKI